MRRQWPGTHCSCLPPSIGSLRQWTLWAACVACLLGLASCNHTSVKGPVAKPPPPRISKAAEADSSGPQSTGVGDAVSEPGDAEAGAGALVSANQPSGSVVRAAAAEPGARAKISDAPAADSADSGPPGEVASAIAAWVNGDVILTQEVIEPIRENLWKARREMPADQYARYETAQLQQQLRGLIEQQLIVQEATKKVPARALNDWRRSAQEELDKKIKAQKKQLNVTTDSEYEEKLKQQGTSLARLRQRYENSHIAQQYLRSELLPKATISRGELIEFYQAHQREFERPARAKWRQILVSDGKHPSRQEARAEAEAICVQLLVGADFAEVARGKSDAGNAAEGGLRDWTTKGSLVD